MVEAQPVDGVAGRGAPGVATPAMRLGLANRLLRWEEILARRLFATRIPLPEPLGDYYGGRIPTRQMPRARAHRLGYAY